MEPQQYIILALLFTIFCFIHSFLLHPPVMDFFREKLGEGYRFYRLAYNIISLIMFIPPALYYLALPDRWIFRWHGPWFILQVTLWALAALLFILGSLHYNWPEFIGTQQIKDRRLSECTIATNCDIVNTGLLGMMRHPLYLGVFILLWSMDLSTKALTVNLVLSAYLVIGTILEERKLVIMFGDDYREYRKRVSMFLPVKWVKGKIASICA